VWWPLPAGVRGRCEAGARVVNGADARSHAEAARRLESELAITSDDKCGDGVPLWAVTVALAALPSCVAQGAMTRAYSSTT
jgi:hypothetical protein